MAKKFLTGLNLVVLDADPATGLEGELYFNSSASVAKIYQAGAWSVLGAGGGGGSTTVSTTEPASPEIGDSWYKNDTGEFYVYDGTYWVEINGVIEGSNNLYTLLDVSLNSLVDGDALIWSSASSKWINEVASGGATTTVSETAPETPTLGDTWYKQSNGSFFIYDGDYWIEVNGIIDSLTEDQVQDYASTLFTHNNHTGITATYDDANGEIILTSSAQDLNSYLTQSSASTIYLTQSSASTTYATQVDLDNIDALPSQTGNDGKYLTTSGSVASWGTLDLSLYLTESSASTTYATQAALNNINGESDQFILPAQIFG